MSLLQQKRPTTTATSTIVLPSPGGSPMSPLKKVGMVVLSTMLMSSVNLCIRLSKSTGSYTYQTGVANFLTETLKCVISYAMLIFFSASTATAAATTTATSQLPTTIPNISDTTTTTTTSIDYRKLFLNWRTLLYSVPAVIYVILNNMVFLALALMDPGSYTVLYNLKTVTTALFMRFFLKKQISQRQWIALGLLTLGSILAQLESWSEFRLRCGLGGLMVVFIMTLLSAFAGTFSEYLLKRDVTEPIHAQNIKLYMFGMLFQFVGIMYNNIDAVNKHGLLSLLDGFNALAWIVVINTAFNGLAVSAIMKYADNIIKTYAFTVSMFTTTIASIFLFDAKLSSPFFVGLVAVSVSIYLYNVPATAATATATATAATATTTTTTAARSSNKETVV